MIKDLYNGEEATVWTDTYDDNGERFVEIVFYANGVSINIPADTFQIIVGELTKASKMLELLNKNSRVE